MSDFDFELRASIPRILVEVVPGEPLSVTLPILDPSGEPVAVADPSTWAGFLQLRRQWSSTEVLHTFTTAEPATAVITAGEGSIVLAATADDTAQWQADWDTRPPQAVGDLFVTDDAGTPHCLCDLVLTLLPRTTRED